MHQDIKLEDVAAHPWSFSSLYDCQYFCCPECEFKVQEKQTFVDHAYLDHPDSIDYLSSIHDGSLDGIQCPWSSYRKEHPDLPVIKDDDDGPQSELEGDNTLSSGGFEDTELNSNGKRRRTSKPNYVEEEENSDYDPLADDDDKESSESNPDDVDDSSFKKRLTKRQRKNFHPDDEVQCHLCGHLSAFKNIHSHLSKTHSDQRFHLTKFGNKRDFQCFVCKAMFVNEGKLKWHICADIPLPELTDGKYKCDKCERAFRNTTDYIRHMKCVHSEKRPFKCDQCNHAAKMMSLLTVHIKNAHTKREAEHICPECEKAFQKPQYLRRHLKVMHNIGDCDKEPNVLCNKCGKSFISDASLKIHEAKMHVPRLTGEYYNGRRFYEDPKERIVCEKDELKFPTVEELNKHVAEAHGANDIFKCDKCDQEWVSSKVLDVHLYVEHNLKRFTCDICKKHYASNKALEYHHYYVHQGGERPKAQRACVKCGYTGPKMSNHWKLAHPDEELPFQCHLCDHRTHDGAVLQSHIDDMHLRIKHTLQCDKCPFLTNRRKTLEKHIKCVHLQIKEFQCEYCSKTFKEQKNLSMHLVNLHQVVFEDEFKMKSIVNRLNWKAPKKDIEPTCQKCKRSDFSSVLELSKHVEECYGDGLKSFVDFKCDKCEEKCVSSEVLQYHRFVEHALSEYVCDICAQIIKSENYLVKHKNRLHYGLKEAHCDICNKGFKDFYTMRKHKERIHDKIYAFKCDHCDFKCGSAYALKTHSTIKHTASPRFDCKFCDFTTSVNKRYRNHVSNVHGPVRNKPKILLPPPNK